MIRFLSDRKTSEASIREASSAWTQFRQRKEIGFTQITERPELWKSSDVVGKKLRSEFSTMCVVGLGGSSLGVQALQGALDFKSDRQIEYFDNVDPAGFRRIQRRLEAADSVCWVFASKSGGTMETLALITAIQEELEEKGGRLSARNAVVVSEPRDNVLTKWAASREIPSLEIPVDVGGRYSVLTPVGMLPAAFMGFNIAEFAKGAELALNAEKEILSFAARALDSFKNGKSTSVFWFYSDALLFFGEWLEQLWAESLGKISAKAYQASTPLIARGASDQHSILQQVADGPKDKWVCFVKTLNTIGLNRPLKNPPFQEIRGLKGKGLGDLLHFELEGTMRALTEKGVENSCLELNVLDERMLGFAFMYFQLVVATLGQALEINAFDQPGVELSKKYTWEILRGS